MIERAEARRTHFRFILDLIGTAASWDDAPSLETITIMAAVGLSELEGRPLGVTKLAAYLSWPRATVQRRVASLIARGFVLRLADGRIVLNPDHVNSPELLAVSERITALIKAAAAALE